jgi:hypothetical protein
MTTHRPLTRRTLLRSAGVALALPLLESMLPRALAGTAAAAGASAAAAPRRRMVAICTNLGIHAPYLVPEQAGKNYVPSPYLQPLQAYRDAVTVVSGVSHPGVDGGHSAEASFLTAAPHPGSSGFRNSISLDQFAAERLAPDTRFASLALNVGGGSLSWTRSGVQIPADGVPSKVFAKLFLTGSAKEIDAQVRRLREGRSVMDAVRGQAKQMSGAVGKADRDKLDEYFTSVRELEGRLTRAQDWATRPKPVVAAQPPKDITDRADLIGRARLMYDLIHLALQTDSTRIVTLSLEGSGLVPPIEGVTEGHHNLSHHGKDPKKLEQLQAVELAEFAALGEFLGKLQTSKEEGQTLLDRTMVLYGSNLGNASSHDNKNMPTVLAGGGFRHAGHLAFDPQNNAPLCNLYVSMLQRMGVEADAFASGKSTLRGLDMPAA